MTILRVILIILFTYLGYFSSQLLVKKEIANNQISILYLTIAGLLIGILLAPRIEYIYRKIVKQAEEAWNKLPPELPLAVTIATTVALLLSVLLTNLLSSIPGFAWYHSLLIAIVLIVATSAVAVRNLHYFRRNNNEPRNTYFGGKALDSSVLIDGRIAEMAELGWLEGPMWVPRFILRELQMLADQEDPVRRGKGRRGLEVLERLGKIIDIDVIDDEVSEQDLTDDKLLDLCRNHGMALITNDAAMVQMARIYGVKALSIQALSIALRTQYRPGDRVELEIIKPGREPGQGVGYLEDGTMVVVDGAASAMGKKIPVVITQSIQTQVGRLVFARLEKEGETGEES